MNKIFDYSLWVMVPAIGLVACNNNENNTHTKDLLNESVAIQSLKRQIAKYPDSVRLYDKLISIYTKEKSYTQAVSWADSVYTKDTSNRILYLTLKGDIFFEASKYDSAIYTYQKYLQKFPDDQLVLMNLANTLAEKKMPAALQLCTAISQRFPTNETISRCFFIKGIYYNRVMDFTNAIQNLDSCLSTQYYFEDAYLEKGQAYFDLHQYPKALATFNSLLQINQLNADAYYWIGKCNEALDKKAEAKKNYEAAFSIDNSFAAAKQKADSL